MNLKDVSVLVVEDDFHTQEVIEMILKEEVKEFYKAFNGKEGFELYKSLKPDIVISDIKMPEIDGIEMIKKIKELNKHQQAILISAYGDKETLIKAINLGVSGFIPKPMDLNVFLDKLKEIVKHLDKDIYNIAYNDSLTKIGNKHFFEKRLEEFTKEKTGIFFIDLDNLKEINDTFGHAKGDKALIKAAEKLKKIAKKDDLIARIGGDEFIFMTFVKNKEELKKLTKKISSELNFEMDGIKVSSSVGAGFYPEDDIDIKKVIEQADKRMYEIKRKKKAHK